MGVDAFGSLFYDDQLFLTLKHKDQLRYFCELVGSVYKEPKWHIQAGFN